jgi:hypothetical protein
MAVRDQRETLSVEGVREALAQLRAGGRGVGWIRKRAAEAKIRIGVSDQSVRDFINGHTIHPHAKVIDPLRAACVHYSWHLRADTDDADDRSALYRGLWRFLRPESQEILASATATYRVFIQSQEYNNYVVAGILRIIQKKEMFFFEEYQRDKSVPVDEIHEGVVIRKGRNNYFISSENNRDTMRLVISVETPGGMAPKIPEFRGRVFGVSTNHPIYEGPYIMKLYDTSNKNKEFEAAKELCYRMKVNEVPEEDRDTVSRLGELKLRSS